MQSENMKRLEVLVRRGGVDALVSGPEGRRLERIEVDPTVRAPERVLEEAVYAAPWLLGEYGAVEVVADTERFFFAPKVYASGDGDARVLARKLWGDGADGDALTLVPAAGSAVMVAAFDGRLAGFVNRTFPGARLTHRLARLVAYFSGLSAPVNRQKLYAVHDPASDRLDVVVMGNSDLVTANSYRCTAPADALYYLLAVAKDCGFDVLDDELVVAAPPADSEGFITLLRRHFNSVMPLLRTADRTGEPLELS